MSPATVRLVGPLLGLAALVATGLGQDAARRLSTGELALIPAAPEYIGVTLDPRVIRRLLGLRLVAADLILLDALIKADTLHEKEAFTTVYRAFKAAVTLDPDNIIAYYLGGMYLSVIKDDIKGATALLRLGARHLETRDSRGGDAWRIYFALGYNLIFEEHEVEEGSVWMRKAAEVEGAPAVVKSLAAKVSTERGRLQVAGNVLNDLFRRADKPDEKARIQAKMLDLAARHELLELNEQFRRFLGSTKAYAFPKKRQLQTFLRSSGHASRDLLGRRLYIDDRGRIAAEKK